jgi:hypothetical protein
MPQQLMPRIKRMKGRVGAGGGAAVAQGITKNSPRNGRFVSDGRNLTDRQRRFVHEYVRNGGNGNAAVAAAGYTTAHPHASLRALLRKPHVIEALHTERQKVLRGGLANRALGVLAELMDDPATPPPVRFQTARTVLQMAGHDGGEDPDRNPPDKPLIEMSIAELEAFVADGSQLLSTIKRIEGCRGINEELERTIDAD